jgi:PAS domain-containing protein
LPRGSVNMASCKETLVSGEGSDKAVLEGAGAYFLSIVEASRDCIRVISADGFVEYMNARGQALFEIDDFAGPQPQPILARPVADRKPGRRRARLAPPP